MSVLDGSQTHALHNDSTDVFVVAFSTAVRGAKSLLLLLLLLYKRVDHATVCAREAATSCSSRVESDRSPNEIRRVVNKNPLITACVPNGVYKHTREESRQSFNNDSRTHAPKAVHVRAVTC